MSKSKKAKRAQNLIHAARDEGKLSAKSAKTLDIVDMGAQISAGLGVDVDDVMSSEVVLVAMMPDDSGSIRFAGNAQAVRDGHNLVLDSLGQCKQSQDIFCHTRYLNGLVLSPYAPTDQVPRMDQHNYDPALGTPLYDQAIVLLGTVLAKAQEFEANGVPVRTVTLLITDGADVCSTRASAKDVKSLVDDMHAAENHIIAAMGIDDGGTDFHAVFRSMGIPDRWILTPKSGASDIRSAFQVFSQSAVRVSQAASLSHVGLGGFVN